MAYTTIDFDSFTQDDWDNWITAWTMHVDAEDDVPCPDGKWDVFFREGEMPDPEDGLKYWPWLVNKYWDFLLEQDEERYSMSFDIDEDCWMHMSREQSYDPRYARSY